MRRVVDLDGEIDVAVLFVEAGDGVRQDHVLVGDRGVDNADPDAPAQLLAQLADVADEGVVDLEDRGGGLVDLLPLEGQLESGTPAPAQRQAEPRFERRHLAADGGGADVGARLRGRKAVAVDDEAEKPEQVYVDPVQ